MNDPNDESATADVAPGQPLSRRGVVRVGSLRDAGLLGCFRRHISSVVAVSSSPIGGSDQSIPERKVSNGHG